MNLQINPAATAEIASSFLDPEIAKISIIISLVGAVIYLYKKLESKNDLFINEIRNSNDKLINICNSYNKVLDKVLDKLDRVNETLSDLKKQ